MKIDVYNQEGVKSGSREVSDKIFGVTVNDKVLQQVFVAERSNVRNVTANTKIRSEVRGGGRKPWQQKGTGRARHGSTRSPLWRKGGVTFGPRANRNFSKDINKKMKRKALLMALSGKALDKKLLLVESFDLTEPVKTKKVSGLLAKLPSCEKTLCLGGGKSEGIKLSRATKNIARVKTIACNSLNVKDVLSCQYLLFSKDGIAEVEKIYGGRDAKSEIKPADSNKK